MNLSLMDEYPFLALRAMNAQRQGGMGSTNRGLQMSGVPVGSAQNQPIRSPRAPLPADGAQKPTTGPVGRTQFRSSFPSQNLIDSHWPANTQSVLSNNLFMDPSLLLMMDW